MDASFHIRPFNFDRVFSMSATADSATRPEDLQLQIATLEAEAALLRVEHERALAVARAEAFDAGLTQAREERDTALLAAADALHASIEAVDARMDDIARAVSEDAAEVALAAAELIAGRALVAEPAAAIDDAIGRVLKQVARGQDLFVRVHPDLLSDVERLIAERQSGDRRRLNLHVVGDDGVAPGDAHIEWDQGGLSLDAAVRRDTVRAELETLLPGG